MLFQILREWTCFSMIGGLNWEGFEIYGGSNKWISKYAGGLQTKVQVYCQPLRVLFSDDLLSLYSACKTTSLTLLNWSSTHQEDFAWRPFGQIIFWEVELFEIVTRAKCTWTRMLYRVVDDLIGLNVWRVFYFMLAK